MGRYFRITLEGKTLLEDYQKVEEEIGPFSLELIPEMQILARTLERLSFRGEVFPYSPEKDPYLEYSHFSALLRYKYIKELSIEDRVTARLVNFAEYYLTDPTETERELKLSGYDEE